MPDQAHKRTMYEHIQVIERELADMTKDRDKWKANHDNQVAINRTLRDRPDLGERAKLVDALTKQRDALLEALEIIATHNIVDNQCDNGYSPQYVAKQAIAAAKGGQYE